MFEGFQDQNFPEPGLSEVGYYELASHRMCGKPQMNGKKMYFETFKKPETKERLLFEKPTLYRKRDVENQKSIVTECAESDRLAYQQNLQEQIDTHSIFKYLKSLNNNCNSPQVIIKDGVSSRNFLEKVNMSNHYFHSVFTSKEPFDIKAIVPKKPLLTYFSISKRNLRKILATLGIREVRGTDWLPPIFFQKTSAAMAEIFHKVLKNVRLLREMPVTCKIATVSPILRERDRHQVENYRPVSLLHIVGKIFEK